MSEQTPSDDLFVGILADATEASDIADMAAALEVTSNAAQIAEENEGKSDEGDRTDTPEVVPVLPLKDTVVFPDTMMPLAVGQPRSVKLIDDVLADKQVGLVASRTRTSRCPAPTTSTASACWPPSRR